MWKQLVSDRHTWHWEEEKINIRNMKHQSRSLQAFSIPRCGHGTVDCSPASSHWETHGDRFSYSGWPNAINVSWFLPPVVKFGAVYDWLYHIKILLVKSNRTWPWVSVKASESFAFAGWIALRRLPGGTNDHVLWFGWCQSRLDKWRMSETSRHWKQTFDTEHGVTVMCVFLAVSQQYGMEVTFKSTTLNKCCRLSGDSSDIDVAYCDNLIVEWTTLGFNWHQLFSPSFRNATCPDRRLQFTRRVAEAYEVRLELCAHAALLAAGPSGFGPENVGLIFPMK